MQKEISSQLTKQVIEEANETGYKLSTITLVKGKIICSLLPSIETQLIQEKTLKYLGKGVIKIRSFTYDKYIVDDVVFTPVKVLHRFSLSGWVFALTKATSGVNVYYAPDGISAGTYSNIPDMLAALLRNIPNMPQLIKTFKQSEAQRLPLKLPICLFQEIRK